MEEKNNFINKFYFLLNFFYCFEPNLSKWCDFNKSRMIITGKRIFTTWLFPIIENESIIIKFNNMFITILFWKIVFWWFQPLKNLFSKIGNGQVIENLFPEKMIHDSLEWYHFLYNNLTRSDKRKSSDNNTIYWKHFFFVFHIFIMENNLFSFEWSL